jgi:hypothetical protein
MFLLTSHRYHRSLTKYLFILFAVLIIGLSACQAPQQTTPAAPSTSPDQPSAAAPVGGVPWVADGIITPGEYLNHKAFGDFDINWYNDDHYIYIGMKAKTMGWVAVGFGAETFMKNANIVQGYFNGTKVEVADQYSVGNFGPHPDVTTLGGTYSIVDYGGKQVDGYTIIEFKRKLDPGDQYHKALVKGTNNIIWAYGSDNQFLIKHISRGTGEIIIQ